VGGNFNPRISKCFFICELHFDESNIQNDNQVKHGRFLAARQRVSLQPYAIPTIFPVSYNLFYESNYGF
jgi:hypothetical protein